LRYWLSADVLVAAPLGIDLLARAADHHMGGSCRTYISQNFPGFFARARAARLIGRGDLVGHPVFAGSSAFSISFLEEMWARNLGNLMMSPLKPIEFLISLMVMSLIRPRDRCHPDGRCWRCFFFRFQLLRPSGLPLIAFFCNLIFTSWVAPAFSSRGLVLRNGPGAAESIVWTLMFGRSCRLACIYYPVDGAAALAAICRLGRCRRTYVFEGNGGRC